MAGSSPRHTLCQKHVSACGARWHGTDFASATPPVTWSAAARKATSTRPRPPLRKRTTLAERRFRVCHFRVPRSAADRNARRLAIASRYSAVTRSAAARREASTRAMAGHYSARRLPTARWTIRRRERHAPAMAGSFTAAYAPPGALWRATTFASALRGDAPRRRRTPRKPRRPRAPRAPLRGDSVRGGAKGRQHHGDREPLLPSAGASGRAKGSQHPGDDGPLLRERTTLAERQLRVCHLLAPRPAADRNAADTWRPRAATPQCRGQRQSEAQPAPGR
ncbi:hypothetical protein APR09_003721 [Nocardia amikacinitolerans]|nr:hypothetical protein [Nocardia amikacinitolerans]